MRSPIASLAARLRKGRRLLHSHPEAQIWGAPPLVC